MNRLELIDRIKQKRTFLCVGLDPDETKVHPGILTKEDWIFEFNKAIIDAVAKYCVAFKPNTAFYECHGAWGWEQLTKTVAYLKKSYPHHFIIADAKRGDIGNTSQRYARTFFEHMDCDAVTVAPYMGEDSVRPFLGFEDKWVILLALTSNQGSSDFQSHGEPDLFLRVIEKAKEWSDTDELMFVAGATRGAHLAQVRKAAGQHFLLVPGVGAQGGDLRSVYRYAALPDSIGLLVNSSRGVIFASSNSDFAQAAAESARAIATEMSELMD